MRHAQREAAQRAVREREDALRWFEMARAANNRGTDRGSSREKAHCEEFSQALFPYTPGVWVSMKEVLAAYRNWSAAGRNRAQRLTDERVLRVLMEIGWQPSEMNGKPGFLDRPSGRARRRARSSGA